MKKESLSRSSNPNLLTSKPLTIGFAQWVLRSYSTVIVRQSLTTDETVDANPSLWCDSHTFATLMLSHPFYIHTSGQTGYPA